MFRRVGGLHRTEVVFALHTPRPLVRITALPRFFLYCLVRGQQRSNPSSAKARDSANAVNGEGLRLALIKNVWQSLRLLKNACKAFVQPLNTFEQSDKDQVTAHQLGLMTERLWVRILLPFEIALCQRTLIREPAQHRGRAHPEAPGSILGVSKNYSDEFFDVAEINRRLLRVWKSLNMLIEPSSTSWWQASITKKINQP